MKAITIHQPWASLIACGAKKIETRSWATKYRGPIAIHAGKGWPATLKQGGRLPEEIHTALIWKGGFSKFADLPLGAVIAIADLVDCLQVQETREDTQGNWFAVLKDRGVDGNELAFGDYTVGRYAWILANVRRIKPVPAKGMQRLWEWEGP